MRGYVREEVQAFLASVATQLADRDARITELEAELARARQQPRPQSASAPSVDRTILLRHLGEEAASILACADASAERMKAQAGIAADRVLQDVRTIGSSLVDVHQLLGELVSLVQGLTEGTSLVAAAEAAQDDAALSAQEPAAEVRTVLGEVLGLDGSGDAQEIRLPEEQPVSDGSPGS